MFKFTKLAFTAVLGFSGLIAGVAKDSSHSIPLNKEPCIAKGMVIDLNLEELHYNPHMVSLDIGSGCFNTLDD